MTGLLLKDYYLLFQRKQTLILFLVIALLMGYNTDGSFIVGYLCFLSVIFSIGSISYDEADNGLPFLLTLPVDRRTYALSKYLLGGIVCAVTWVCSLFLLFGMNAVKSLPMDFAENLTGALAIIPVAILELDIMIPIQLKFGMEKSRLVLAFLAAIVVVSSAVFIRHELTSELILALDRIPTAVFAVIGIAFTLAATLISISISTRIMEQKVF